MSIEVVESRSDDETCSCSAAPSDAEEEIRDGSVSGSDERDSARGDETGIALKTVVKEGVPDSIPEEPSMSMEETKFSAGTQDTATTEGTEGTEASMQRNEKGQENGKDDCDSGGCVNHASGDRPPDKDDHLLNVPSDEDVFSGVTQADGDVKPTITELQPKQEHHDEQENAQAERDNASLARQQWENAVTVLKANPSLMTADILKLALHNRPPLSIIKFMVGLNPNAAGVPRSGPSALQIAVRHHASLEVVEEIIRACPYALFTGNGTYDPLTYAKIWRREDEDLIKMLERPISYWISGEESPPTSPVSSTSRGKAQQQKRGVRLKQPNAGRTSASSTTPSRIPDPPASPDHSNQIQPPPPSALKSPSRLTKDEKRELSNIKLITAAIVKSQKKQMAEAENDKRDMDAKLMTLAKSEALARRDMVKFVDERVKKSCKAHLVAIDMKERAFESRIATIGKGISDMLTESTERQERLDREREERDEQVLKTVEGAVSTLKEEILAVADRVEKAYGTKLAELAVRVDTESVASAAFRNDVRHRQGDLEQKVENALAGECFVPSGHTHTADTSFEVQSIPATNSTDHLFGDDFGGIDETHIMGSKSSGEYEYGQSQIQNSFSSEWNNSRRGLVEEQRYHTDASWWKAMGASSKKKKSKGRWKWWLKFGI